MEWVSEVRADPDDTRLYNMIQSYNEKCPESGEGGGSTMGRRRGKWCLIKYIERVKAASGLVRDCEGEMMWEKLWMEFSQTARGGKLTEEAAQSQWNSWVAAVNNKTAKASNVMFDYDGPQGKLRIWVKTADKLIYRSSYMKEKEIYCEGETTKKATEEDIDKLRPSESPAKAEADIPAEQVAQPSEPQPEEQHAGAEFLKPPTAEAVESDAAATDDVPPVSMDFEEPKEEAPTGDTPMPSVEERPPVAEGTPIVPTEITTTTSHISSSSIINVVQNVEGKAVHAYEQPVKPPEPIIYSGTGARPTAAFLEAVNCCHCGTACFEGQQACFSCGGPVKPGQMKAQHRRTRLARGREEMINQLADAHDAPRVFLNKVKSASKDVAGRGMASFEGENIRKAKVARNKAINLGFKNILDRFNRSNVYACSLAQAGVTRRGVRVMDCLVKAYLPNPGRTTAQRTMAVGSNATVTQEIGPHRDDVPHCRLVFFDCDAEELCVAGLTSTPDDTPIAFTWYGAFLSHQDFVKNCSRCPTGVRLQTFGHGFIDIRGNDAQAINENITTIIADDLEYASQTAAEARAAAQRSQAAQPKYATHLPPGKGEQKGQAKGKGKGKPREPPNPPPQRPPRGEAEWSWYNRGWTDREWDQWYSQWHGWQQRGWNWR